MRTYCVAQETLLNVCGDLNEKEIKKGGTVYILTRGSLCSSALARHGKATLYNAVKFLKRSVIVSLIHLDSTVLDAYTFTTFIFS